MYIYDTREPLPLVIQYAYVKLLKNNKIIMIKSVYFIVPSGKKKTSIEVQFDDRVL